MNTLLFGAIFARPATVQAPKADPAALEELGRNVKTRARQTLGRSLAIRVVDAGSCNGCELEINALGNAAYDLSRFGLHLVASPRHADVLLVTGPVTRNMKIALERTWAAMPAPKWVVAAGQCTSAECIFAGSYACTGGLDDVLKVDVHIPGCPPSPEALLKGLLALLG